MTASKILSALSLSLTCALAGCTPEPPTPAAAEASASAQTEGETETEAAAPLGAPKIASDAAIHEFGAIKATDSIEHVFTIKNEGDADLHIERVQRT